MMRSVVRGLGAYLPARVMENEEFEALVETSAQWIVERTGIQRRHIAAEGERTSDLGAQAASAALADAGLNPRDIDLIVLATTTPDETMPATATRIQHKLGVPRAMAFDVNAACSGFVYAVTVADALLKSGAGTRALVIGAETYSRILNWQDRGTCILFGDGAGALVLEAQAEAQAQGRGVLVARAHAEGQYGDLLATTGGVSSTQTAGTLFMQGKEIFRHATVKMADAVLETVALAGLSLADIDLLAPHQANWRILAAVAQKLGMPEEKVISTVANHANTSAASIPLALAEAKKQGKLRPGSNVALCALGAGLTWGACIIKW